MFCSIFINVGNSKKPWTDVPIEVLIEEERKRKESLKDHREHLHAPPPRPPCDEDSKFEEDEDYKIVIKL